jgi:Fusaric acid resistance protein-like
VTGTLQWLRRRDPDLAALRRAGRAAIVMPAMFALGEEALGNPVVATFAAFGSFAMLLLVDFAGSLRERLQAQTALAVVGCAFVCLGTLVSHSVWLASATMALVGFAVIFAGVISSVLVGATTSLLLAFILPATLAAPVSAVPDRVAGWGLAAGASLLAVTLLWPAPTRDRLRAAAAAACRSLAGRLRVEVAAETSNAERSLADERQPAMTRPDDAVVALRGAFLATPYRPASLGTAARATVRLVDQLNWLNAIVGESARSLDRGSLDHASRRVGIASAAVLEQGAALLAVTGGDCARLHAALSELSAALRNVEASATGDRSFGRSGEEAHGASAGQPLSSFITSLDPSFRAQELGFAVSLIGQSVDLTAAAERRGWLERLLGRQPEGLAGTLTAAQQRASAHVDRNSVWLHNSLRGAAGLALAVFVADRTGVQHSFWVVLGTLSVLRSNALSTGQNVLRALAGTAVGFVVGAAILAVIGTDQTLLWLLLPPVILLAGVAPAAISFAAGQAAFTLTLVFLFNIIQPTGWRVGLLRIEDIALGCAVSLAVGVLFWPRGAGSALRRALADAYADSADYLAGAVNFGMLRCDATATPLGVPTDGAERAAAAAHRLDDAFRSFLAERGAKPVPLAQVTSLVTGVGGLRLAADAVLDLWEREDGSGTGNRSAAREELLKASEMVKNWYEDFAHSLVGGTEPRAPLPHDDPAERRLIDAVRHDLLDSTGRPSATAVRIIWTGDHLDAARRMQERVLAPAQVGEASGHLG